MLQMKEKADLFYKDKKWIDAHKIYSEILNKNFDPPVDVYAKLAIVQRFLKDYDGSEETLKVGLLKFPEAPSLIIEYAALENVKKNWGEALKLWREAKNKTQTFSALNYNRYAKACEGFGENKTFIEIIKEGIVKFPNDKGLNKFMDEITTSNRAVSLFTNESKIDKYKQLWNFDAVKTIYKESLKVNNKSCMDYFIFLADIGQLDVLFNLINYYGFKYFEDLISDSSYISNNKTNVNSMLSFYKEEYIPALNTFTKNISIESDLIYLANQNNVIPLHSYLLENYGIFKKDNPKSQMILNFAINKLIDNNLFNSSMALKIIDLYTESISVNKQRKKYLISNMIDYFYKRGESDFFVYLGFNGGYIQKIASVVHRYGDNELGAKIFSRKLHSIVKSHSIEYKKIEQHPRIAVCISGMIRGNATKTFELLKKNIITPLNADVFIHTWDERHGWMGIGGDVNWIYRQFGGKVLKKCPNELKLTSFMEKNFPNVFSKLQKVESKPLDKNHLNNLAVSNDFVIESQEDFLNSIQFPLDKLKSSGHLNQAKMLYGIYQSTELMKQYEKKKNFEYDYIVRCRPDIGLNNTLTIESLNTLDEDEILVDFYSYGPQDQFRAGRRGSMILISNIWIEILKQQTLSPFKEQPNIYSHNLLHLWMIQNNLITSPTNIKRDVSMASREASIPSISKELELDWAKISKEYQNREDFKAFFELLINRK